MTHEERSIHFLGRWLYIGKLCEHVTSKRGAPRAGPHAGRACGAGHDGLFPHAARPTFVLYFGTCFHYVSSPNSLSVAVFSAFADTHFLTVCLTRFVLVLCWYRFVVGLVLRAQASQRVR